jgi:SAM-dependent methyltransferase
VKTDVALVGPEAGAGIFGGDAGGYDRGRPRYPSHIYTILQERCGVGPATNAFEIGPGTGQATKDLLDLGASSVVAIEPDERLAVFLSDNLGRASSGRLNILNSSLLDADVPEAAFGLGIAATSFHWVEPIAGLAKVRRLLRPGGWWAMWWNIFGDPAQPDEFQRASKVLFSALDSSPFGGGGLHHALDVEGRTGELAAAGFEEIQHKAFRWTTVLSTDQVLAARSFVDSTTCQGAPCPSARARTSQMVVGPFIGVSAGLRARRPLPDISPSPSWIYAETVPPPRPCTN